VLCSLLADAVSVLLGAGRAWALRKATRGGFKGECMRFLLISALALAACSQPAPAPQAPAPAPVAAPAIDEVSTAQEDVAGPFIAVSTTAMSITGDMSFSDDTVSFMNGILLRTAHVTTGAVFDAMNAAGDSFDDVAPGADNRVVDVRRVTAQEVSSDAAPGGLCGATAPTYVALVHDIPIAKMAVVAFTGDAPPGRGAAADAVCATFSYEAR